MFFHCYPPKKLVSTASAIHRQFWIFRRKIVWERENYQDYTVCRAIDCHFPLIMFSHCLNFPIKSQYVLNKNTFWNQILSILMVYGKICRENLRTFSADFLDWQKTKSADFILFWMYDSPRPSSTFVKKITFFLFLISYTSSSLSMVDEIAQLFSFSVQSTEVKWLKNKIHKIFFVNLCEGFPSDQTVLPPTTPETLTFYFGIYCWNWISCHLCHSRNIWHNFHIILHQIVFTFACGSSCCFHLCMYYCIGIMVFG